MILAESVTATEVSFFLNYYVVIALIMIVTGMLGGFANYFLTGRSKESSFMSIIGYCIVGIVAAFIVPLFLNMISSDLLKAGKTEPLELFVFAGFCLISAVFARKFLESISNKILQQVDQLTEQVEEVTNEPESFERELSDDELRKLGLDRDDLKLVKALAGGRFLYRSRSGLSRETNIDKTEVSNKIAVLMHKGLVAEKTNKQGNPRWYVTPKGRELFGKTLLCNS